MIELNNTDIRIEDLAHPVLTEMQQGALEYGKTLTVDLSVAAVLGADERFRSMPYFESRQPVPSPREKASRDKNDPRFQRTAEAWAMQDALLPLLKNMHAMTPEHIHEEIELQDLDFSSYTLSGSPMCHAGVITI